MDLVLDLGSWLGLVGWSWPGGGSPPMAWPGRGALKIGLDFEADFGGPEAGFWMVFGSFFGFLGVWVEM